MSVDLGGLDGTERLQVDQVRANVGDRESHAFAGAHGERCLQIVLAGWSEDVVSGDHERVVPARDAVDASPMVAEPGPHLTVIEARNDLYSSTRVSPM
jgi:hypothetical protein